MFLINNHFNAITFQTFYVSYHVLDEHTVTILTHTFVLQQTRKMYVFQLLSYFFL